VRIRFYGLFFLLDVVFFPLSVSTSLKQPQMAMARDSPAQGEGEAQGLPRQAANQAQGEDP